MLKIILVFFCICSLFGESLDYRCLKGVIHVIEVDPYVYEIRPVKALDDGIGRESVLSMSNRYGAVAAVNGGFFTIGSRYDGKASGALKIGDWYAMPFKPRGCIGWSKDSVPLMDRLLVNIFVNGNHVDGLNSPRKEGEMVLFTPSFHRTTLTNPDGQEIIVIDGIIKSIKQGGSSRIPENGYLLSIQKKHPLFNTFKIGDKLTFSMKVLPLLSHSARWESFEYIVGGVPILLYNSKKIDFSSEQMREPFCIGKHARTAVGILPNGHLLFVLVDRTDSFEGMTIPELADLMEELGCSYALNLDGGKSSTLIYKGTIKNFTHGDEEELGIATRRVSDAILILPKKP